MMSPIADDDEGEDSQTTLIIPNNNEISGQPKNGRLASIFSFSRGGTAEESEPLTLSSSAYYVDQDDKDPVKSASSSYVSSEKPSNIKETTIKEEDNDCEGEESSEEESEESDSDSDEEGNEEEGVLLESTTNEKSAVNESPPAVQDKPTNRRFVSWRFRRQPKEQLQSLLSDCDHNPDENKEKSDDQSSENPSNIKGEDDNVDVEENSEEESEESDSSDSDEEKAEVPVESTTDEKSAVDKDKNECPPAVQDKPTNRRFVSWRFRRQPKEQQQSLLSDCDHNLDENKEKSDDQSSAPPKLEGFGNNTAQQQHPRSTTMLGSFQLGRLMARSRSDINPLSEEEKVELEKKLAESQLLKQMSIKTQGTKDNKDWKEVTSDAIAKVLVPEIYVEDENGEGNLGKYRTVCTNPDEENEREDKGSGVVTYDFDSELSRQVLRLQARVQELQSQLMIKDFEAMGWKKRALELERKLKRLNHGDFDSSDDDTDNDELDDEVKEENLMDFSNTADLEDVKTQGETQNKSLIDVLTMGDTAENGNPTGSIVLLGIPRIPPPPQGKEKVGEDVGLPKESTLLLEMVSSDKEQNSETCKVDSVKGYGTSTQYGKQENADTCKLVSTVETLGDDEQGDNGSETIAQEEAIVHSNDVDSSAVLAC